MTIARSRRRLYSGARVLGDVQAVRWGRIWERLFNRLVGRGTARLLRGVWR